MTLGWAAMDMPNPMPMPTMSASTAKKHPVAMPATVGLHSS